MERTKNIKTPSLILCSDMHLREDTPSCFIGDFQKEQWDSLDFIRKLQQRWNIPVLCGGDLFHHWKTSPWLLTKVMKHLPAKFFSCMGQHDLPQHNLELVDKSGFGTLIEAGYIKTENDWDDMLSSLNLQICHWEQEPVKMNKGIKNILLWHHTTYLQKPFPGASGGMAVGILRKYPQFDLIVTGDIHQSFTTTYEGRRLVNPGNLTRQSAQQIDFKPSVWLWYAEDNSVEQVFLPIQANAISREHIDIKEQRNERIDAFVEELQSDWESNMSFEDNLKRFQETNDIKTDVMNLIFKAINL